MGSLSDMISAHIRRDTRELPLHVHSEESPYEDEPRRQLSLQVRLQVPPVTTLLDLDVGISASGLRQINFCDLNHTDYSIRGGSWEELPHARGQGQRLTRATQRPKSGGAVVRR